MADALPRFQHAFAAALRQPDHGAALAALCDDPAEIVRERLALYRGNVLAAAARALGAAYPVVKAIVGDEFFDAMAHAFWRACPAESGDLNDYGDRFPRFLDSFEPARSLPYLADVATLEWRVHRAYFAADAPPFAVAQLAALAAPEQARVGLHPAAALLATEHPAVAIWSAHQQADPDGAADALARALAAGPQRALIARPHYAVTVQAIDRPTHALLASLGGGAPLGAATECALAIEPDYDLAAALASLEATGALGSVTAPAADGAPVAPQRARPA